MKSLNKYSLSLLLILSFSAEYICAQFKSSTPIYAGAISPNKSKIAFADSERISILNTNTFEVVWSIPCNHAVRGVVSEIFFSPNNDSIICFRASKFNGDLESDLALIYFSDSLFVGNFISGSLRSYPGNVHVSFGAKSGDFCAFANFGHEFNFNQKQNWWADGSVLFTKELDNIELKTPVLKCSISSDGEKIAILTRSQNSSKPNELQVLDIHSQNIIYKEVLPEQYYTNLQFSDHDKAIYLESCRLFQSGIYSNYISDLENVKDTIIPLSNDYSAETERVWSKQEFGLRLLPTSNGFKIFDLIEKKDAHFIHPITCNLFNIHNAFLINSNEIIVFGSYSDYSGTVLTGAANKMKLTDVSAFTKIDDKTGNYRLFNPNDIRILPNTSAINNNSEKKIVVGENKKFVYVIQGRYMEMWGIEDPSILRKFSFENDVEVLADKLDSTLLVLEKHNDLNGTNIRIHVVNLNSGFVNFQILSPEKTEEFVRANAYSKINDIDRATLLSSIQKTWPWDNGIEHPLLETSISTDNEEFVLLDEQLLNFKTLERIQVQNFSDHALLDDKYVGMAAELYDQNFWELEDNSNKGKNTSFIIKDIRPYGDTLAVSPRFKLRVEEPYYQSQLSRSSTSRFVCASVNEFFQETKRDLYVFDIKKNKVHEFLNEGLCSIAFNENDSLFQIIKYEMSSRGESSYSYELYDSETFKKTSQSKTSFFEFGNAPKNLQELISPESDFEAVYIRSESGKKTFGFFPSGKMFVWNDGDLSPFTAVSLGTGKALHCSFVGEKIFIVLESREAFFVDPITAKVVCTILFLPNEETTDILWFLPDGSFYAAKNTIPKFHMVKGKNAFPLLNYESLLNRPDKILAAIGLAEAETIEAYALAYQKRSAKFKTEKLNFNSTLPLLTWNSKIPAASNDSLISFAVGIDYPVQETLIAHVLINGVPVYGMNGLQIEANKKEFQCTTTLESGKNEILVYVQTQNGLNSFPLSKEINSSYNFKRRLYFVGIGVSEYIDTTKNLSFAHSDVLRLRDEFSRAYDYNLVEFTLTNSAATKSNILKIKPFLMKAGVNDIVVVAFAGHGTIGVNNEFYFCPTDMDFKNPETSGIGYSKIEYLLDSLGVRKKLLMLDACHSGELDSTEQVIFTSNIQSQKDSRGIEVVLTEESASQKKVNYLVESLFANLSSGTGTFVISASAGNEYAFESESTGGVFTHSFLESFRSNFYSYDSKPFITTLQKETYERVINLTHGAQRPTTRSENTRYVWKFEQ